MRRSVLVVPPSMMPEARPINDVGDCSIRKKKFFKVKIIEILLEKNMLENIDVDTIINDFASRNARRQCFL